LGFFVLSTQLLEKQNLIYYYKFFLPRNKEKKKISKEIKILSLKQL